MICQFSNIINLVTQQITYFFDKIFGRTDDGRTDGLRTDDGRRTNERTKDGQTDGRTDDGPTTDEKNSDEKNLDEKIKDFRVIPIGFHHQILWVPAILTLVCFGFLRLFANFYEFLRFCCLDFQVFFGFFGFWGWNSNEMRMDGGRRE